MSKRSNFPDLPLLCPGESRWITTTHSVQYAEYRFGTERQNGTVVGTLTIEDKETGKQLSKLSMTASELIPELEVWLRDLKLLAAHTEIPPAAATDREKA